TLLRAALVADADPDVPADASRALELLVEKARSFGGRIEGMSPTGIVAAFGFEAVEDAPSRAAHAAMAMQRAIEAARRDGVPLPAIKVGIHLDQFLVGLGRGAAEIDLDAKQKALAVLAPLADHGEPGSILVSEVAARFLERRFELFDFGGGVLGRVFALAGRERTGLGVGGHVATFVGRHRELELLWSRLESAIRGQGQIVGISGEAGIGKARLLYEFRQSVAGKPVGYLEGQCVSYGAATPYLPVLDLLRAGCAITEADAPELVRGRVHVALQEGGMDPAESAPYLLHLLGIAEDPGRFQALEPDAIKARIFETLRQMWLRRSRQLPLVMVVENLHWIDTTSEELFASLAEILPGARILLVSTSRAGYRPPWIEKSYATQVTLQPLAPDDSLRVLRSVLGTERVADALADRIVKKAEGNPLFLEELARTVRERANESPTLAVPDTIQEVIRGRIDRLAPDDKRLLEIAAVVGRDVSFSIVQIVAGLPDEILRAAFNRLKSADFLYETSPGPETEYTFRHALTQEVAYERLLDDRRPALHGRIVDAIEARHPDRLGEHIENLAHHAFRAGAWAKAVGYLRQAAMKAFGRAAHREAVAAYEQALAAVERLPEGRERTELAIDLRLDLRTALLPLGELERVLAYLREAEALAVALGDQQRLGRLFVYLTGQYYMMGDHDRAFEAARRSGAIAGALNDFALEVSTNSYLGQTCFVRGEYARAVALFRRNVEALVGDLVRERFGLPQLPAVHSRFCLVWCLAELGEFGEAIARGEEAIAIAESVDQPLSLTVACSGLGVVHLRKGELDRAIPILERGLELSRNWHIPLWFPRVASALGYAYAVAGRATEALPLLEHAIEQADAMRLTGGQSLSMAWLGEAKLLAGRGAEALELARRALDLSRQNKERGYEGWVLRLLGEIARRSGAAEAARAREHYADALERADEIGMRPLAAHCRLGLGQLDVQAGDRTGGTERLVGAKAIFNEMAMPLGVAQADAELARLR
ncbi:MAG: AAA family ATPase, partial [Candidatus Rokuibacteriota bacterium]